MANTRDDVRPFPADNDHEGHYAFAPVDNDAPPSSPLDDIKSGLKVWADVGVTLGKSLDAQTRSWTALMERLQHNTPVDFGSAASGVAVTGQALLLNFGSPDQGRRWEVTNLVVGGTDANIAAAGTAALYVSGQLPVGPGLAAPAGMTAVADVLPALPAAKFYGTRQIVVNDQEYLFAIVFGGTNGQTYAGNASVTVVPVDAAGGRDVAIL